MKKEEAIYILKDLAVHGKGLKEIQFQAIKEVLNILKDCEQRHGADDYDFTNPSDNPYILSGDDLSQAESAARSR